MDLFKNQFPGIENCVGSFTWGIKHKKEILNLFDKEVYLNIVGGLKIVETSADLAVASALISSARDIPLATSTIAVGEIGLSGEIRMVSNLEARLKEAHKLGFKNCIIPKANEKNKNFQSLPKKNSIEL